MMAANITDEEREMMRDAYRYLAKYIDPPANGSEEAIAWWEAAVDEISDLVGKKWNNHPLIMQVMLGVFSYLEHKAKEATKHAQGI